MRKAGRDIQLAVILGRQNLAVPLPKRGRAASDIHRHIKHLPLHHPHQFALGMRQLVVQTAQGAVA